jgi:hypothetical protein
MRLVSRALIFILVVSCAMPRVGAQQQHVVDQSAIQNALDQHSERTSAKRQTIRAALSQPDVMKVAERLGLDVARADAAIGTLQGAELDRVAAQAQVVNDQLAGGQTVTLNLIWVILGLLVLLLLIAAVD